MHNFFLEKKKDNSLENKTWSLSTLAKVIIAMKPKICKNEEYYDYDVFDSVKFCARMKMISSLTEKSTKETSQNRLGEKNVEIWLWWNKYIGVSFGRWMQMKIKSESPSALMKTWTLHLCRIGNQSF